MTPAENVDLLLDAVRVRICSKCPGQASSSARPAGDLAAPCETDCELIRQLPRLTRIARQRDPMLQSPEVSFRHAIDEILAESALERMGPKGRSPLYRFRDELAAILARLGAGGEHLVHDCGECTLRSSSLNSPKGESKCSSQPKT